MKNSFEIQSWDEAPYLEFENGAKYSKAKLMKKYSGNFNGQGQLEYLMAYNESGAAYFTGIEHFDGTIGTKTGTMSIVHQGSFENGSVTSSFEIVNGSQTGELAGISGEGKYQTGHSMTVEFDFSYS